MEDWVKKIRSSHRWCSVRKGVLRNFAKFSGKHLFNRAPLGDCFWKIRSNKDSIFTKVLVCSFSLWVLITHFRQLQHQSEKKFICDISQFMNFLQFSVLQSHTEWYRIIPHSYRIARKVLMIYLIAIHYNVKENLNPLLYMHTPQNGINKINLVYWLRN